MPTAVAYARFSTDRQHESSIEAQRSAIEAYAERHGITILAIYADRGISGTTDKRPEFLRLLSDLKTRPVDFVLVHKYDRFSRSRYDAAIYARLIQQRGGRLVAVAQDFGVGPEAVIMEALMQAWAEYYSLNLSTEVIKGRKVSVHKGRHPGGMYPFGYESDGAGGYRIVELEAYYIRKLYQATVTGSPTIKSITDEMREAGIRGRRGGYLTTNNVAAMLKSPIYAGIYEQQAAGESERIENHHPAIVPMEIYEEALKVITARQNAGRAPRQEYLLTGMVRCCCGKPMYAHVTHRGERTYASYLCYGGCGNRSIQMSELDEAACGYVRRILAPEVREQLTAALTQYIEGQRRHAERSAPARRREIERLRGEIDALTANLASGVLPPSVVERLGKQIQEAETQIEVLSAMNDEPPACDPGDVLAYFADVATVSSDMPVDELRPILRRFIASIVVHPTAIEFTSTFDAWLREHFPQLCSPHPFPPQGPDDPKGGNRPPRGHSAPSASSPANPASSSPNSCTPSVSNSLDPARSIKQFRDSPDARIPAVSNSLDSRCRSSIFGELLILISPYIVKRNPREAITGVVASHILGIFDKASQ